ncbi:lipid kinase [Salinarimonas ramus]|uniref:Lipid kinase n=1 Tax=Salinarimonas ramus TaxID=690164 RepID=A0A917QGS6_9HYPH|nr:lipid kinase [Salinarimonas ramus]GGK50032.1 lipid kinase [Salinarimonas ramus]
MARIISPDTASAEASAGAPSASSDGEGAAPRKPARVLVLVNPHSRRGADCMHDVAAALEAHGIAVVLETFSAAREVSDDIRRLAPGMDAVIVCGGDGTINAALPGILETGLPLGVAPCGTANDFARTLGLPPDPVAAMSAIVGGRTHRIDLGVVNGRPFLNVASIGLSVDLAKALCKRRKRIWGRLAYALAALGVAFRARPFTATILSAEGEARAKTYQVAVGNGRFYGGGMVVEETATIDDGTLDLYSLEMKNVWRLVLMLRCFAKGAHGAWADVRTQRGVDFEVRTRKPRHVNADGEIVATTPARFSILPEAISVFVP